MKEIAYSSLIRHVLKEINITIKWMCQEIKSHSHRLITIQREH